MMSHLGYVNGFDMNSAMYGMGPTDGLPKSVEVPANNIPSSATKSVACLSNSFDIDEPEEDALSWKPIVVMGCFTDSDMSKKIYANILMPSGISKPNQVKVTVNEGLDSIMVSVLTPALLCDAFNLHKDTMANCENVSQSEINQNLRVMNYNSDLASIGHKKGEHVWWKAIINLPETACTNKFSRKKFKLCPSTNCLVLCVDLLVEDSNYLEEQDDFECVHNY